MTLEETIDSNARLIYKIANRFYGVEKEDLYQAGVLGLIKAFNNYNQNSETKFSTYAYDYIYGEMYALVSNKIVKINKDILKIYRLIEKTRYMMAQNLGRIPTNEEISLYLELSIEQVEQAILAGAEVMSLDEPNDSSYDFIKSKDENIDEQIYLNEGMKALNPQEKDIIKARYYEDLTQSEVARKLRMTQVMVSRYEKKGLNKMQAFLTR